MSESRVQIYDDELREKLYNLQDLIEKDTGFKPAMSEIGVKAINQYIKEKEQEIKEEA